MIRIKLLNTLCMPAEDTRVFHTYVLLILTCIHVREWPADIHLRSQCISICGRGPWRRREWLWPLAIDTSDVHRHRNYEWPMWQMTSMWTSDWSALPNDAAALESLQLLRRVKLFCFSSPAHGSPLPQHHCNGCKDTFKRFSNLRQKLSLNSCNCS